MTSRCSNCSARSNSGSKRKRACATARVAAEKEIGPTNARRDAVARHSGMTRIIVLILIAACGGGDDESSPDAAGVQGSCFYSCNTGLGTSYGCTTNAQITSTATCDMNAATKCGSSTSVGRTEFSTTCGLCDDFCAPSWHNP